MSEASSSYDVALPAPFQVAVTVLHFAQVIHHKRPKPNLLGYDWSLLSVIYLLFILLISCCGCVSGVRIPPTPRVGSNVMVDANNVADPTIVSFPEGVPGFPGERYILFYTSVFNGNVPVALSDNMRQWVRTVDALPVLPRWASSYQSRGSSTGLTSEGTWGPSVVATSKGWVLFFSTRVRSLGEECIGAAFAEAPTGPYLDTSNRPLICQPRLGGSIDPDPVNLPNGQTVLLWKSNGSHQIWEEALSSTKMATVGKVHLLIGPTQAWEHGNVEGPDMIAARSGGWWLFYAGSQWYSDDYGTGVAWCENEWGPCEKKKDSQLLLSGPGATSPGGLSTFKAEDGEEFVAFSTFAVPPNRHWNPSKDPRELRVARLLSY